ncbi:hypothetical protein DEU56DRAFT_760648 [Suillus clintonianus]|uniref:uncharacterized protein n=1 Tax=Suillus clintonianus TaxID=1904413 RepID=UPI001B86C7D0|nr:uncharacterized protein DEU56DRAFT_760648 [Suillus clintonianus]KAG2121474.1 hypothetical protein DEU56DRAFT_760648 [Suillus clintonianus]
MADRVTDALTREVGHAAKEYDSLKGMSKTNGVMKALSRVTSLQPTIPAHNVHRFWTKRLGERPIVLQLCGRATRKHAATEINSLKGMSKTNGAMEALSRVTARQSTIPAHNGTADRVTAVWTTRKHAATEINSLKGMSKTNGAMEALSRVTARQSTIPAHNGTADRVTAVWTTRKHAATEINSLKGMSKTNGAMEALSRVTARQSTIPAHNVHRFWTKRLGERPIALQRYGRAT